MNLLRSTLSTFLIALLISCNPGVREAKSFIEENINQRGNFDVMVLNVEKIDGEFYKNKYTNQDMYALEFSATVRSNQEGYVLVQEDGRVRNLNLFNDEPKDIMQRAYLKIKEIKHIKKGNQFEIHNRVIMVRKDSGWEPIALRWDLI